MDKFCSLSRRSSCWRSITIYDYIVTCPATLCLMVSLIGRTAFRRKKSNSLEIKIFTGKVWFTRYRILRLHYSKFTRSRIFQLNVVFMIRVVFVIVGKLQGPENAENFQENNLRSSTYGIGEVTENWLYRGECGGLWPYDWELNFSDGYSELVSYSYRCLECTLLFRYLPREPPAQTSFSRRTYLGSV